MKAQIAVDPIPGASAPLVAAVASGFPLIPLTILGFPPRRSKDRTMWFSRILAIPHTVTFFESPHRIAVTLSEAAPYIGRTTDYDRAGAHEASPRVLARYSCGQSWTAFLSPKARSQSWLDLQIRMIR